MRAAVILIAVALGASESATDALHARDAQIRAALPPSGEEVTPEARHRVERIITKAIDLRGMVEAAMAKKWHQTTEAQHKRLVAAFEQRFRQMSGSDFGTYRSTKIEYQPEVEVGEGRVNVPTRVVVKGEPTEITYTMRHDPAGWHIVDIVVDGVSTVANYRASFARIISKEGVEGLIRRLQRNPPSRKS